ncbi:MAG: hypothetical protein HYT87_18105 [Nitrospirae bacterium]|nr:hypothetical protein [Nitrospirota bacterium]
MAALYACSDDEAEISCPAGKTKAAVTGGSCLTLFNKICACKPLPTGVNQADCDLLAQGYTCDDPGEAISDSECSEILTSIEQTKTDICKSDLS